jgi:hypothetical protein
MSAFGNNESPLTTLSVAAFTPVNQRNERGNSNADENESGILLVAGRSEKSVILN